MKHIFSLITIFFLALDAFSLDYAYKANYGIVVNWNNSDIVGVYAKSGTQSRFVINSINSTDRHNATSFGYGVNLKNTTQYFSMYPYSNEYYENDDISTSLPIIYDVLTQTSNDNLSHIAQSDFMQSSVMTTAEDNATFNYEHLCAILRLSVLVPEDATFNYSSISSSTNSFVKTSNLNIENKQFINSTFSSQVDLKLNNIGVKKGKNLAVYYLLPVCNLSGSTITAKFYSTSSKTYSCTFSGKDFKAGKLYDVGRTISQISNNSKIRISETDSYASDISRMANVSIKHKTQGVVKYPTCVVKDYILAQSDISYDSLPPEYVSGDTNGDGNVSVMDVAATISYLMGVTPSNFKIAAADVNKDNKVTLEDINLIVKKIIGK